MQVLLCWIVAVTVSAAAPPDQAATVVALEYDAGAEIYQGEVRIRVDAEGEASVHLQRHRGEEGPIRYSTRLSPEELGALRLAIRAADFFNLQDHEGPPRLHRPEMTIRVTWDDREHTVRNPSEEAFRPLEDLLGRLTRQAELVHDLSRDDGVYDSLSAVSSMLSGRQVLQPAALVEPLQDYLRNDGDLLHYAIEALAHIQPPDQWLGFIVTLLENADDERRSAILTIVSDHSFVSNIPRSHRDAIDTLYAAVLLEAERNPPVTERERLAVEWVRRRYVERVGETPAP